MIEMPFAARDAHPAGRFAQEAEEIIALPLGTPERALKERMRACFPAQSETSSVALEAEEFHLVPRVDFKEPSHGRKVFTCVDEDFPSGAGALEEDFGRQAKAQA